MFKPGDKVEVIEGKSPRTNWAPGEVVSWDDWAAIYGQGNVDDLTRDGATAVKTPDGEILAHFHVRLPQGEDNG